MSWTLKYTAEQWSAAGSWIQALAATFTLVVAVFAAIFARNQVREARTLREAQAEPFVTATLISKSRVAHLVIANQGATVARNVQFTFSPEFHSAANLAGPAEPTKTRIWTRGIPTMVPGQSMEILIDTFVARYPRKDLPQTFDVEVRFEDFRGKKFVQTYVVDFEVFYGVGRLSEKSMHELVLAIERLHGTLRATVDRRSDTLRITAFDGHSKNAKNRGEWGSVPRWTRRRAVPGRGRYSR